MLTLEHVQLRRKKTAHGASVAEVVPLCGVPRPRALELAALAVSTAQEHAGRARSTLEEALDDVVAAAESAREARLARGLKKLALDACTFDVEARVEPEALRHEVFLKAAQERRAGTLARAALLGDVAAGHGLTTPEVESALYADLASAQVVRFVDLASAEALLARAAVGELQAVLLRSTELVTEIAGTAQELRAVLRALKLHQLLFDVEPLDGGALRLTVAGPMGMFQQSTRYGLKLAVLLPSLLACREVKLTARARLRREAGIETVRLDCARDDLPTVEEPPALAVATSLMEDLTHAGPPWTPRPALDILRVPGAGVVVPDLELVHNETGEVVAVEILGFWSRSAVWKRVELVERGLPVPVVFCASERLRVSEEALPEDSTGALVIWKGALRAARVRQAADRMTQRRQR